MTGLSPDQEWKSRSNAEYQKVVSLVVSLSTGVLVLPVIFLRQFLAVPIGQPLSPHLDSSAYASWVLLSVSIFLGTVFYYASAKWIKNAFGGTTTLSTTCIECILDWSFWGCVLAFLAGIGFLVGFGVTHAQAS
jgi:hypothetical protein